MEQISQLNISLDIMTMIIMSFYVSDNKLLKK